MSVTFDPVNRLIIEDSVGGDNSLRVDVIYSLWKDWFKLTDNSKWPRAFRYVGGDPISDTKELGATFFLMNNWKFRPAELDHDLELVGNLFTDPAGDRIYVPTVGAYTVTVTLSVSNLTDATVSQLPEIEYASFNGGVTIDEVNGTAGTTYPAGTPQAPTDNYSDGLNILQSRGLTKFYVVGDSNVVTYDYSKLIFIGESKNKSVIDLDPSANLTDCEFYDAHVTGTLDGGAVVSECYIDNLSYVSGFIEQCVLAPGTITLGGSAIAHFLDCWSGVPGTGTPVIDLGGSGQGLALRNYNGGIKLQNKTGSDDVSLDLNSGQVILASTITAGTIVARGIGKLVDESGNNIPSGTWNGATIVNELVTANQLAEQAWAYTGP